MLTTNTFSRLDVQLQIKLKTNMSDVGIDEILNRDDSDLDHNKEMNTDMDAEKTSPAVSSSSASEKSKPGKKVILSPNDQGMLNYELAIEKGDEDEDDTAMPTAADDDDDGEVKLDESKVQYPLCDRTWCKDRDPESSAPCSFPDETNMDIELSKKKAEYAAAFARDYHVLAAMFSPGKHWPKGGLQKAFYDKKIAKLRLQKKMRIHAKKLAIKNQRKLTIKKERKEKSLSFDKEKFIKSIDSELVNCQHEIASKYMMMVKDVIAAGGDVSAVMTEWEKTANEKVCEKLADFAESILEKPKSVADEICTMVSTKFKVENGAEILAQVKNDLSNPVTPSAKKKETPEDLVQEDAHRASKDIGGVKEGDEDSDA